MRVFRLSRIRGKVSYATKAEHDFRRPDDFDPRAYANRADWQLGEERGVAEVLISERIAWQIERHFGRYGEIRDPTRRPAATPSADCGREALPHRLLEPRGVISWVLGLGAQRAPARPRRADGRAPAPRSSCWRSATPRRGVPPPRRRAGAAAGAGAARITGARRLGRGARPQRSARTRVRARDETAIRPERFARLVRSRAS